ncbi:PIN domain-containing protein, partial [Methylicorpusculum sp.]
MNLPLDPQKKLFVLDTNVLMHDPTAIFRFQEHNLFIPMIVLEELDHGKKGLSEVARNVRQVSRFLDELIQGATFETLSEGLPLSRIEHTPDHEDKTAGRLFFQTSQLSSMLPESMPGHLADNSILAIVLALSKQHPDIRVCLVSKDINLRIKAATLALHAEDYHNDQTLDDINLLYSGSSALDDDFWEKHGSQMESWQQLGRTFYK